MSLVREFAEMRGYRGYDLIMADPPWRFNTYSDKGLERSPEAHYQCMTLEDIAAMPVPVLAADHSVLWLWATAPMIMQAFEVMKAWGFEYKTMGTWAKYNPETGKRGFGTGYLMRSASEPFLIGTRGKPKTTRKARNLIVEPRREHSRKPEAGYVEAEIMMPDARRLELFSRTNRPGWDVWGNEVGKFPEATTKGLEYA